MKTKTYPAGITPDAIAGIRDRATRGILPPGFTKAQVRALPRGTKQRMASRLFNGLLSAATEKERRKARNKIFWVDPA